MSSHRSHAPLFIEPRVRTLSVPATRNLNAPPPPRRRFRRWLFRLFGRPLVLP